MERDPLVHIPDGYLDPVTCLITYALTLMYAIIAWRRVKGEFSDQRILAASVLAAGVFAAQMIAWPIPGGTSLHFLGGALAGILFGPWMGFYVMALVLVVQALVFHDGGLTTLGANILNMAVIGVVVGYYSFKLLASVSGKSRLGIGLAAALAGWLSLTLAGIAAGLEIGFSPTFPYGVAVSVPIMGLWHAILGVLEGAITSIVYEYLYTTGSPLAVSLRGENAPITMPGVRGSRRRE